MDKIEVFLQIEIVFKMLLLCYKLKKINKIIEKLNIIWYYIYKNGLWCMCIVFL